MSDTTPVKPPFHERWRALGAIAALVSFLPFLEGALRGRCFYYRDLVATFFPLRRFAVDGLLRGEIRFWNPFSHEGEHLALPALSYPIDLLQLLLPDERGFSLLLALHVPAAALTFMVLARHLRLAPLAAAGGGLAYALGGFTLSCLNLYVYLPAVAWAPLVVLGLLRAGEGGPRQVAEGGLLAAVAISTLGMEIVLQSMLVGLFLATTAFPTRRGARLAGVVALACALTGPLLLVLPDIVPESRRAGGLPVETVLAHSIHPLAFAQVLIGRFFGDLSDLPRSWWGQNFFVRGFPYFQSLYLGATVLSLAAVGALRSSPWRTRLLVVAAAGMVVSLGPWSGMTPLVEASPLLRILRFPSKAFFAVHLALSLLAALGLDALVSRMDRAWRRLAAVALAVGVLLSVAPAIPTFLPGGYRWFLEGLLPPGRSWPAMQAAGALLLQDAAQGGLFAVLAGLVALAVHRKRTGVVFGALATVGLLAGDLVRAGTSTNAMVTRAFFAIAPDMAAEVKHLREGRLFTCEPHGSPSFARAVSDRILAGRPLDPWTYSAIVQTLTPNTNVPLAVPTAFGVDHTMLFPLSRVMDAAEADCHSFPAIAERLRRAGVSHVISLEPLADPDLRLLKAAEPPAIHPLRAYVYGLEGSLPLRHVASAIRTASDAVGAQARADLPFLQSGGVVLEDTEAEISGASGEIASVVETPGRLRMTVVASAPTAVVVRESFAAGWSARVDGRISPVRRADARHLAVRVPAGTSEVTLRYVPPHLWPGMILAGFGAVATLVLRVRKGPKVE